MCSLREADGDEALIRPEHLLLLPVDVDAPALFIGNCSDQIASIGSDASLHQVVAPGATQLNRHVRQPAVVIDIDCTDTVLPLRKRCDRWITAVHTADILHAVTFQHDNAAELLADGVAHEIHVRIICQYILDAAELALISIAPGHNLVLSRIIEDKFQRSRVNQMIVIVEVQVRPVCIGKCKNIRIHR